MDTYWDRIEPHTRSDELEEGLQARIADPLWFLARQWQLGELRGEDAASPIHLRVDVVDAKLRSFRNEAVAGASPEAFPTARPLEARVEAEVVSTGPGALQLAAEAGLAFLRRLDGAGLGALREELRRRFPLDVSAIALTGLPVREVRRIQLLGRRALDGRALLAAPRAGLVELAPPASRDSFKRVLQHWHGEIAGRFVEPGGSGDTWVDDRLEYAFTVAASPGDTDLVLSAREYPGGQLDWYAFDVDPAASHELGRGGVTRQQLEVLPVPLSYAGMPSSRWWELEEGTVYFGGIEAGPADLARLLVAEFGTVYSDDWFVIPVRLPVGSVARIRGIDVIDTFGGVHHVKSTAVLDHATGAERPWAFFELAGDPSVAAGANPWLALPPTLNGALDGEPVEHISFVRDEAANLAWAIEQTIETATGRPLSRRLHVGLAQTDGSPAAVDADAAWRYRLQTSVPPYWIPLLPERVAPELPEIRLRRARLLAWEELDRGIAGAKGRILAPERALRLHEEEIPSSGVQVTRGWQLARGVDGRPYLWMARRKRPGRGERGSGLQFDTLAR